MYNGQVTGEVAASVTSASGISNATGPKVMQEGEVNTTPWDGQRARIMDSNGVAPTLQSGADESGNIIPAVCSWNGDITPKSAEDVSVTLRSQQGGEGTGVAFTASDRSNKAAWEGEVSGALNCQMNSETSNLQMGVRQNMVVRRLTPMECCRLMAWPDDYLDQRSELELLGNRWARTGKTVDQADSAKYKQAGNGVASNCSEWIARRLRDVLEA